MSAIALVGLCNLYLVFSIFNIFSDQARVWYSDCYIGQDKKEDDAENDDFPYWTEGFLGLEEHEHQNSAYHQDWTNEDIIYIK